MGIAERKDREFQRRERDILDAALALISTRDGAPVTVDEIAQAAEVGKGTVYKHFGSKEEIYGRLALDFHRQVLAALQAVDLSGGVVASLRAMVRVFWRAYRDGRRYQSIIETTARESFRRGMSADLQAEFERLNQAQFVLYAQLLERGMAEGLFVRQPILQALVGPQAVINGLILMIWSGCVPAEDGEGFVETLTDFLLAGLRGEPQAVRVGPVAAGAARALREGAACGPASVVTTPATA